ncbi:MAG: filamentous hemagglutinin N-terminal protein, partial [Polaromonas sp.]|nr:filamentous hemagglutinin N-terminal protein [Polaromonas sp.]
ASGGISNQGSITAQGAGLVALVAPSVVNQGSIVATGGTIALAGSTAATVSLNGGLYEFAIPTGASGTSVSNLAGASLNGARIRLDVGDAASLLSGVINLEGLQQASSAIVVNAHNVVLKSALQAPPGLQAPLVSGNASNIDVFAGARIQDAVNIANTGTPGAGASVNVKGGTFNEQVLLNKANLTLSGSGGAKIVVPDVGQSNGITINASGVTVTGMEIAGPANLPYLGYAWGSTIPRGIAVVSGATGFNISNNNIHDVRNGILIDGRNTGSVTGNRIENTKSAVSVQYTDGSCIVLSGNTQGPVGNEWGLNLHLNGYWNGANILSNPLAAAPTATWQQALLALSAANAGWSVQDQGYTSANRTQVTVANTGLDTNQGSALAPLAGLQAGVNAVVAGGLVNVMAGNYVLGSTLRLDKAVTLAGAGQSGTLFDARAVSGYGIDVTADHVSLRDFTLYGPTADAAASYGIKVAPSGGPTARLHDFDNRNDTVRGSGRAELDLNGVVGAVIDHVTADGSPVGNDGGSTKGAGIQIADSADITVRNSVTRQNAWGGLALYQTNRAFDQQVNNITVEANNSFGELNPVFMQDESASKDFGAVNIAGFGYAVRNAASANDNVQYTWLQASTQKALDFAVNVAEAGSSYVQGWNGAAVTQDFQVGTGNLQGGGTRALSFNTALANAAGGAAIRIAAGQYQEDLVVSKAYDLYFSGATVRGLTLNAGAAGTGLSGAVTASGAGGIVFNAPVRLLGDTTLATQGADITLNGDIQNAGGVARALSLVAGSGANRGNVRISTGGSQANPLGRLEVLSNRFDLLSTLWLGSYRIQALGDVALSNHTMHAQDANAASSLNAGGNVTGSSIGLGAIDIASAGNVTANITGSDVAVQAQGAVDVVVNASESASLAGQSVVASVVAPVVTVDAVAEARISGSSPNITIDAPTGSVSGNFGQVTNAGSGLVNVNGKPQGSQATTNNAENNRVMPNGNTLAEAGAPDAGDGSVQLALAGQGEGTMSVATVEGAAEALDRGQPVELDLSPRNGKERKKK